MIRPIDDKRNIYIAGPMQGYRDFNFPAFHLAASRLRSNGWFVFSPAERDERLHGKVFKSEKGDLKDIAHLGFDLREALTADLSWILTFADAIYMLKGWEHSSGAFAEWSGARSIKLRFEYE